MKKLLVLGGGIASYDVVINAKEMGIYVIAVDREDEPGISRRLADEEYQISTTDFANLKKLIEDKNIDGVFCGPSELRLIDAMNLCGEANLRFYCTKKQWDICSDKASFKDLCRKFSVPCVPEFHLTADMSEEDLKQIRYPVIVKPVDGCSSAGMTVCWDEMQLKLAIPLAISASRTKHFIVEKYVTSDYGFGCRYIANKGEIYLSATNDRYTVDTVGGKALISCAAIFPSKKTDYFMENININIINMFKSIGIENGTLFMQALYDYDDDEIYFHEMGLRLSGGLIYPMLEAACGYNDLKMMLRFAVGGEMATEDELLKIDPYMNGKFVGSLCIPLKSGKIDKIMGMDTITNDDAVISCTQYYHEGDMIEKEKLGTLGQHFCRFKIMTNSEEEYKNKIKWIQEVLEIRNSDNEDMIYRHFDIDRMK